MKSWENEVLSEKEKVKRIKKLTKLYRQVLLTMGFDVDTDPNLIDTPKRISKMMINEVLSGNFNEMPKITTFKTGNDDIILSGKIPPVFIGPIKIKSMCSHHFMPFIGSCYVELMQTGQVIGISKIPRLVQYFMRRPHLQEKLTDMIGTEIYNLITDNNNHHEFNGVAVYVKAQHLCMSYRGVQEDNGCYMTTHSFFGAYLKDTTLQSDFINRCERDLIK